MLIAPARPVTCGLHDGPPHLATLARRARRILALLASLALLPPAPAEAQTTVGLSASFCLKTDSPGGPQLPPIGGGPPPPPPPDTPSCVEGIEGRINEGGELTVTATLSGAVSQKAIIKAVIESPLAPHGEISPAEPEDYGRLLWFSIEIPAGQTTGSYTLRTYHDDGDNNDEVFWIKLDELRPSEIWPSADHTLTVTILDDDTIALPAPRGLTAATEGDGHVTLSWDAVAGAVDYSYDKVEVNNSHACRVADFSPLPTLSSSSHSITHTAALLTMGNHDGEWWYKETSPNSGTCTHRAAGETANLSNLTQGTTYTYKAYSNSTCTTEIASETFTTLPTIVSSIAVGETHATLRFTDRGATWSYKRTAPTPAGPCYPGTASNTAGDVGLRANTVYTYKVYSDGACTAEVNNGTVTFRTMPPLQRGSTGGSTEVTVENLTVGSRYCFRVRARAPRSTGNPSFVSARPRLAPVSNIRVTHNGSSLTVNWDAAAGATGYDVTYRNHTNGVNARAAWNQTGTSATITCDSRPDYQNQNCIASGSSYTVGVRARYASGEGEWRNSAEASQANPAAPDAVAAVRVTHNGSSLAVGWDAPARATHYDVVYSADRGRSWARGAWNRAGTSITITCDSRYPGQNRDCVASGDTYTVAVRARNASGESEWRNSPAASSSSSLSLEPNVPNPFNPSTTIRYGVPEAGEVQLVIYNLRGQKVRTLIQASMAAGFHSVVWDGRDSFGKPVASGIYIYRLSVADFTQVRRMTLIK